MSFAWATIVRATCSSTDWSKAGEAATAAFPDAAVAPYSGYLTLAFLVGVVILMLFDKVQGPWLLGAIIIGVPALIGGWFLVRHRVRAAALDAIPPLPPTDPSVAA